MRKLLGSWKQQLARTGVQKALRNTGWLTLERALRLCIGLSLGAWLARYLGPVEFGLLSYATAFVGLFGIAVSMGTDSIVVRDLVRFPDKGTTIMSTAMAIRIAGAATCLFLIIVAATNMEFYDARVRLLIVLYALTFLVKPFEVSDLWFRAQTNSKPVIIARSTAYLLASATKVFFILGGASVVAFVACDSVAALLGAALLVIAFRRYGRRLSLTSASRSEASRLLKQSWPLLMTGLAIVVYMRIDMIMLERLLGDEGAEAVGMYAVAIRLSEVWYFIPLAIVSSLFPKLVQSKKTGEAIYHSRIARLLSFMTVVSIVTCVGIAVFGETIILLLFGAEYAQAAPILSIHIWALIFVAWGAVAESWYVSEGLTKLSMQRTLLAAFVNIVLNLILIPTHGAIGAALSTVMSYGCSAWLFNLLSKRTRIMFLMQARSLWPDKLLK